MLSVTGLQWFTLTVAVVGCVVGVASLAWQIVTWQYTGPRIKVASRIGLVPGASRIWTVTATNVGRAPVQVTGWGFLLPDGRTFVTLAPHILSHSLPTTVDGGHEVVFAVDCYELHSSLLKDAPGTSRIKPYVSIAGRDRVFGKEIEPAKAVG